MQRLNALFHKPSLAPNEAFNLIKRSVVSAHLLLVTLTTWEVLIFCDDGDDRSAWGDEPRIEAEAAAGSRSTFDRQSSLHLIFPYPRYVIRTRELVVLDDASISLYSEDEYVKEKLSSLCYACPSSNKRTSSAHSIWRTI